MIDLKHALGNIDGWSSVLSQELRAPYFLSIEQFLQQAYTSAEVYPPAYQVFNALELTPIDQVRVVILGQDPYHNPGQAHGLAFSVKRDQTIPPSLRNIFREMSADTQSLPPTHGDLTYLARQGVLLLNTTLTVEHNIPQSHANIGWTTLTDRIIERVSEQINPVVFILWGKPAQLKSSLIDSEKHLILSSVHPSPLSAYRGFFGSRPFSQANRFLKQHQRTEIDWCGRCHL